MILPYDANLAGWNFRKRQLLFLGNGVANAGKTINESGAIACISSLV
jgi:hypothetical protein